MGFFVGRYAKKMWDAAVFTLKQRSFEGLKFNVGFENDTEFSDDHVPMTILWLGGKSAKMVTPNLQQTGIHSKSAPGEVVGRGADFFTTISKFGPEKIELCGPTEWLKNFEKSENQIRKNQIHKIHQKSPRPIFTMERSTMLLNLLMGKSTINDHFQ